MLARNEEIHLSYSLGALQKQSLPIEITLINDGSTDSTVEIAESFGVNIISLPYHSESYTASCKNTWKIARALNEGFPLGNCDYLMHMGADMILPETYVENIVKIMDSNPWLVVASGQVKDEPSLTGHVRGSGRLYKAWFWNRYIRRFPERIGWETYPLYKAQMIGLKVQSFPEIQTETLRRTRNYKAKYGMAMRSYGYFPPFALAKCAASIMLGGRKGVELTRSYLFPPSTNFLNDPELSRWLQLHQVKSLFHPVERISVWKRRLERKMVAR